MSNEQSELIILNDIDVSDFIKEFEGSDMSNAFDDIKLSHFVLNNEAVDIVSLIDEYNEQRNMHDSVDKKQSYIGSLEDLFSKTEFELNDNVDTNDQQIMDNDDFNKNVDYNLYEETVTSKDASQTADKMDLGTIFNPFESIADDMAVKQQPKPDQRSRYASDSIRFLPDSRKHPMSIKLPDLSSKDLSENESFGLRLTMVTSTANVKQQTYVHVNKLKYRTDDIIDFDDGSIFIPLSKADILKCEKTFPRLSIICQKFDEYSFDLTVFDPTASVINIEKYTLNNEDVLTKVAKGKQFTVDYDLLCYKIIFQLVYKQENCYMISHIQCETNLINEQKTPTKVIKQKISSNGNASKNKKNTVKRLKGNSSKKPKSSASSPIELPVNRRSKQVKGDPWIARNYPCGTASSAKKSS